MIIAEIITIGDEILYGQIIDTNSSWIGQQLSDLGIQVAYRTSVGDVKNHIIEAFSLAKKRSKLVIITGGLGPTKDDITKQAFCEYFKVELVKNKLAYESVANFFAKRNRELTPINETQGFLPANAIYIPNEFGTAPAMWFEQEGTIFVSMPGVPFEMKGIMKNQLYERFKKQFNLPVIYHKIIKTIGIGESFLAERIENWENSLPKHIKLAYLPNISEVKLRLTGHGTHFETIEKEVNEYANKLFPLIHEFVYASSDISLAEAIGNLLIEKNETVATAESCTGGYISHLFTQNAGSSAYFKGAIVSYDNEVKENILKVEKQTIENYGAVSEQVVSEMAQGILLKLNTNYSLATSGVAGPGGGTAEKPVGTVWVALAHKNKIITKKLQLQGSREQIIHQSAIYVLNLLRKTILTGQ